MTILCPFCALKGGFNVVMCVRAKRLLCCLEKSVKKENRWQCIEGQRLYSFELLTFLYLKTHVLCLLIQNSTEIVMELNSHRINTKLFLQNFISIFSFKVKHWLKTQGTILVLLNSMSPIMAIGSHGRLFSQAKKLFPKKTRLESGDSNNCLQQFLHKNKSWKCCAVNKRRGEENLLRIMIWTNNAVR